MSNEKLEKVEQTIFYRNTNYKSQFLNERGSSVKRASSKPDQFKAYGVSKSSTQRHHKKNLLVKSRLLENSSASRVLLDSEYHGYADGTRDTSLGKERALAAGAMATSTLGSLNTFGNSHRQASRGRGTRLGETASISLSKHRAKLHEQASHSVLNPHKTKTVSTKKFVDPSKLVPRQRVVPHDCSPDKGRLPSRARSDLGNYGTVNTLKGGQDVAYGNNQNYMVKSN